jgi:2,4-dienoyl-CoA reductase-like NADH-dependent reductase (Old Yellow Enzyme family)
VTSSAKLISQQQVAPAGTVRDCVEDRVPALFGELGAHGYLIDTLFRGETNTRTDRRGGDLVARTRFAAQVVKAIRAAIGPDLPIILRGSQWKQQDDDAQLVRDPKELGIFLRPLVDAGVDLFYGSTRIYSRPAFEGSQLTLAGWARKVSGKPTMAVGGVGLSKDLQSSFAGGTVAINDATDSSPLCSSPSSRISSQGSKWRH